TDSKSDAVSVYSMVATRSRRFSRLDCDSGGASNRCNRRRRFAVLLTYGSAAGSPPRNRNTAATGGICAKKSAASCGENEMEWVGKIPCNYLILLDLLDC